jgi:hypothetical protein
VDDELAVELLEGGDVRSVADGAGDITAAVDRQAGRFVRRT